jgi:hypothetical protein
LQAYPKLALAYYQLVQILAEDHVDFIANLDPGAFHYIMVSMLEGLGLKEIKNAVCACVILDNILTHHLKYVLKVLYSRRLACFGFECPLACFSILTHHLKYVLYLRARHGLWPACLLRLVPLPVWDGRDVQARFIRYNGPP